MLIRSLLVGLALCWSTADAAKPPLSESEAVTLFFETGYTFCDARLLASKWGLPMPYGAKIRTGRFLDLPRGHNRVSRFLSDVRTEAAATGDTCDFGEIGLEFADIELLARAWGMETWDVKTRVSQEFMANRGRGIFDKLPERLVYVDKYSVGTYRDPAAAQMEVFREPSPLHETRFTMCDAEKVALAWQTSLDDAVERLQEKARTLPVADQLASIQAVREALPQDKCAYYSDFVYEDAELIAAQWGIDIYDAKATLGTKLDRGWALYYLVEYAGRDRALLGDEAISQPVHDGTNRFVGEPNAAAFDAHGWTACDAVTLARLWNVSEEEARARAGAKILHTGPAGEVAVHRADAARLAQADGFTCDLSADLTDSDISTLATAWDLPESDARELALDKLQSGVNQGGLHMALGHFWR